MDEYTARDGIFWHKCERPTCDRQVEYDDEPYCYTHSPDSGSSQLGYSARRNAEMREQGIEPF